MFNVNFTGVNFAGTAVFQNRVAFCQKRCYTMLTWLFCLQFLQRKTHVTQEALAAGELYQITFL